MSLENVINKAFVLTRCGSTKVGTIGVYYFGGGTWRLRYAALTGDGVSVPVGDSQKIVGAFGTHPEFAGCPACGTRDYVKCGSCHRLSCWKAPDPTFYCGWCPNSGPVSGTITELGTSGG